MINFKVSAPGKLNLFGENLTCEDHNGVMASMDRRTTVKFNELPRSEAVIKFEFPEIYVNCTIHLRQFRNFYKRCTFDDTLSEQILEFISSKHLWDDDSQKKIGHTLFYLLAYVTYKEEIDIKDVTPFQVYLEMDLSSVNFSGLASTVVCFTTCFLHWSNLRRNDHHELNDNDRAKISMYSKSCNKIFDYCRFKSDVTVSTYGCILRYHCKDSSQNDVLDNMPSMKILIIDSTVDLDKTEVTKAKANLINCYPHIANSILNSIRVISDAAFSVLKEIRDINKEADTTEDDVLALEQKLLPLIRLQQELNKIFIKFSEQMDSICRIARRYQLSGKCAGFNHARYTYIWCPPDCNTIGPNMGLMLDEFRLKGFAIKEINLDCNGVKIE